MAQEPKLEENLAFESRWTNKWGVYLSRTVHPRKHSGEEAMPVEVFAFRGDEQV